jgi:hypothetical protein
VMMIVCVRATRTHGPVGVCSSSMDIVFTRRGLTSDTLDQGRIGAAVGARCT